MRGVRLGIGLLAALLCALSFVTGASAEDAASEAAPGAQLELTELKFDKADGTATLLAKVSGPGRLYLYGKDVIRRSVRSSGAGIAKLKVAAEGGALKTLRATGKAKLGIKLKFVTSEGGVAKKSRSVTLHLNP